MADMKHVEGSICNHRSAHLALSLKDDKKTPLIAFWQNSRQFMESRSGCPLYSIRHQAEVIASAGSSTSAVGYLAKNEEVFSVLLGLEAFRPRLRPEPIFLRTESVRRDLAIPNERQITPHRAKEAPS
ncbi:hypothetical protein [Stutzerimonas nitrititolerans]|uniref:hypothetical protein n=1 Tax=Stutzerimonas nitrititolerans TaxID=2482751 RepID=UPI00289F90F3|nr:hypothetical protein [Stutzerimonas nitrititolerans]